MQGDFMSKIRDIWKKYKWVNFNDTVRAPMMNPLTGEKVYRDVKRGMNLFWL